MSELPRALPAARERPRSLPAGRLTFLFTDVQGSTRLFQSLGSRYIESLQLHRQVIRDALEAHGGLEITTSGDSFFAVFASATDALASCAQAQRELVTTDWPDNTPLLVRMGMHTGEAAPFGGDYVSLVVHQAARVSSAAHGGQVLMTAHSLEGTALPAGSTVRALGEHVLRDFDHPVPLLQLIGAGLLDGFPPPRSARSGQHNLPLRSTPFIGRSADIDRVTSAVRESRCVSITGVGGLGKTRLAVEAAEPMTNEFPDGVVMVELAPIRETWQLMPAVAAACGVGVSRDDVSPAVVDSLSGKRLLLLLDNCEHVIDAAAEAVDHLLRALPRLQVLCTTRTPLRIDGEHVIRLDPLPPEEAARLLVDRARFAGAAVVDDDANRQAVEALCLRVDGIPLALELLAVQAGSSTMSAVAEELENREQVWPARRGGDPRQRSVEATLSWSWELLDEAAQMAWARLAVLANGASLALAVETIATAPLSAMSARAAVTRLVEESVYTPVPDQPDRFRLLEPVRQFGLARLPEAEEATTRVALAEALVRHFGGNADSWEVPLERLAPHMTDLLGSLRLIGLKTETSHPLLFLCASLLQWGYGTPALGREVLAAVERTGGITAQPIGTATSLTHALRHFGFLDETRTLLTEWIWSGPPRSVVDLARAETAFGDLEVYLGNTREAALRYQRAYALVTAAGVEPPDLLWERLGETAIYADNLDEADRFLSLCIEKATDRRIASLARSLFIEVCLSTDQLERAEQLLADIRREWELNPSATVQVLILHNEAGLATARGDHERAEALAREALRHRVAEGKPFFIFESHLTLLRALAPCADRTTDVLDLTESCLAQAGRLPWMHYAADVLFALAARLADERLARLAYDLAAVQSAGESKDPLDAFDRRAAQCRHGAPRCIEPTTDVMPALRAATPD